ncbi:hypothetical protein [Stenotrophomonas sp. ZAC14D2_NAIMI4_6]|uniref:hypothetical protein n=1 Tax=Stenotrophomonas sp. ZAC14D2_NAIMI4_6 TaxID=2072406 RepID=UPI000D53CC70|nr:hypothetical protein [Stenotrophomonas sp. ZAC14D2_NAIMI4_6]AWH21861.1 hypothetical protein C1933_11910 [Stenotrophomonas sp. ZAC14D2_NAIMI4_6]
MALQLIDIDAPAPNGKTGESARSTHIKVNANTTEIGQRLEALEADSGGAGEAIGDLRAELQQEALERQQDTEERRAADAAISEQLDVERVARQQQAESLSARITGRNRLVNGNFDFSQRGNSGIVSSAALYTADRWICSAAGGVQCNWGIGSPAVGEIPWARRFLGFNIVAGTTSAWVGQRIENASTFAGGKATVSFWARSGVAGKKVGLLIQQVFGSGGSAIVQVDGPLLTLGTAFQKFTATFDVPAVAGKTYGANDNLLLCFFYSDNRPELFGGQLINQTGLFELAQVQFESGEKATEFDFRPLGYELTLCQRYYEKSYNLEINPGSVSGLGRINTFYDRSTSGASTSDIRFRVTKRAIPALVIYSDGTGETNRTSGNTGAAGTVNSIVNAGTSGAQVNYTPGAGSWGASFQFTADAEI